ncbi:hypothetical protein [Gordonia sputi]
MHENNPDFAFWFRLSQDERDLLDQSARTSALGLTRYPYWDGAICAELLAWKDIEIEILEAHHAWLTRLKARAERHGRAWTHEEMLRQCRLTEAGD